MIQPSGVSVFRSVIPESYLTLVERVVSQAEVGLHNFEYSYEHTPGTYSLRQNFQPELSDSLRKISCLQHNEYLRLDTISLFKQLNLGDDFILHRFTVFIKQAYSSLQLGFHQDIGIDWPSSKYDGLMVAWMPLQHTDASNGSLSFIPFSHSRGLVGSGNHINPDQLADIDKEVTIEASRGDLALFNPRLVHRSGANMTGSKRYAINILFSPT